MQPASSRRVVIIGSGISGLSAGWYLRQHAAAAHLPLTLTILEAQPITGGKIRTDRLGMDDPAVIEWAADSFITQKPYARALVEELGLAADLIPINRSTAPTAIFTGGRLHPLPKGLSLLVPTDIPAFLQSPIMSAWGKARLLMDTILPRRRSTTDESLAHFVRRRMGAEALDKLGEPLLGGIYNGDVDAQSIAATFPRYPDLERRYGSIIRGTLQERSRQPATGTPPPPFLSLRGGMGTLIDALTDQLKDDIRRSCPVARVEYQADAATPYTVHLTDGEVITAQAVILATPAYVTAALVRGIDPELAGQLSTIRYVSTGTVAMGFHRSEIALPIEGYGVVIPHSEGRLVNALTIVTRKFNHRASDDTVLIRAFFGGSRQPGMVDVPDNTLLAIMHRELRTILGITVPPRFARIIRLRQSSPQYDIGHQEWVARLEQRCPAGMHLIGSAYRGVGIPDCIKQGNDAAHAVVSHLATQQSAATML